MNNAPSTTLQKLSFVLLLFIAAALGYLIVRQFIPADGQQPEVTTAAPDAPVISSELKQPTSPPAARTAFAPLRPRIETNVIRVGGNRVIGVPVPVSSQTSMVEQVRTEEGLRTTPTLAGGGALVGNRVATGRAGQSVFGRVLLRGNPPPEKSTQTDAVCSRLGSPVITSRHYVVGQDGGLADVFVYIKEGAPPAKVSESGARPLVDQINCEYQPYILGVQVGQKFTVRNSDPLMHNVHLLPLLPGNRERNVAQAIKGAKNDFVFEKPEVFIQLKCDVHPWMFAYIGVVDHPWFSVTDKKGNFTLPSGLPTGDYKLAAVHRKLGESIQQISVNTDGAAPVTFTFEVPEELAKTGKR